MALSGEDLEYQYGYNDGVKAERKRCAEIADGHAAHLGLPEPRERSITDRVAKEIAARILDLNSK